MRFHEHVKGDVAEHQAIIWLWQKGYLVCKNLSQHGPVDLVAIKENETILIDVIIDKEQKLIPKLEYGNALENMTPYTRIDETKKSMIIKMAKRS